MTVVSEPVDDWDAGMLRHLVDDLVGKGADHDALYHPLQVLGHVVDRLALAQADLSRREIEGRSAQLVDPHVEADPRPQGRLLEDQGEGLPTERTGEQLGIRLDQSAQFDEFTDFLRIEIPNR